jgi:hypothetical protein
MSQLDHKMFPFPIGSGDSDYPEGDDEDWGDGDWCPGD